MRQFLLTISQSLTCGTMVLFDEWDPTARRWRPFLPAPTLRAALLAAPRHYRSARVAEVLLRKEEIPA